MDKIEVTEIDWRKRNDRDADGSYLTVNPKPKFIPFDICRVVGMTELILITEVNLNKSQTADEYQWSFAGNQLNPKAGLRHAWYSMDELEYVNNFFEILASSTPHPFGSTAYKFSLSDKRR